MLVISRKLNEEVVVPDVDLVFTILKIDRNKVRVGISAPAKIVVHRREVLGKKQGVTVGRSDSTSFSSEELQIRKTENGISQSSRKG